MKAHLIFLPCIGDPGYDKTTSTTARACVSRAVKKHNGHIRRERLVIDYAAAAMEQMQLYCAAHPGSPSAVRRPQLFFRSDLWIALLGPSMEEGIAGIGPTIAAALRAFDAQYLAGLRPPIESARAASALQADATARRPYRRPKTTRKFRRKVSGSPGLPERDPGSDFGTTAFPS